MSFFKRAKESVNTHFNNFVNNRTDAANETRDTLTAELPDNRGILQGIPISANGQQAENIAVQSDGSIAMDSANYRQGITKEDVGHAVRKTGHAVKAGIAGFFAGLFTAGSAVNRVIPASYLKGIFMWGLIFHYVVGMVLSKVENHGLFVFLNIVTAIAVFFILKKNSDWSLMKTVIVVSIIFMLEMGYLYKIIITLWQIMSLTAPMIMGFSLPPLPGPKAEIFMSWLWPWWALFALYNKDFVGGMWLKIGHLILIIGTISFFMVPQFAEARAENYQDELDFNEAVKAEGEHSAWYYESQYALLCSLGRVTSDDPVFKGLTKADGCRLAGSGVAPPDETMAEDEELMAAKMRSDDTLIYNLGRLEQTANNKLGIREVRTPITVISSKDNVDVEVSCEVDNGEIKIDCLETRIQGSSNTLSVGPEKKIDRKDVFGYIQPHFLKEGKNEVSVYLDISDVNYEAGYKFFVTSEKKHNEIIDTMKKNGKEYPTISEFAELNPQGATKEHERELFGYYQYYFELAQEGETFDTHFYGNIARASCYVQQKTPAFIIEPSGPNSPVFSIKEGKDDSTHNQITLDLGINDPKKLYSTLDDVIIKKITLTLPNGMNPIKDGMGCIFNSEPEDPDSKNTHTFALRDDEEINFEGLRKGEKQTCIIEMDYSFFDSEGNLKNKNELHSVEMRIALTMDLKIKVTKNIVLEEAEPFIGTIKAFPVPPTTTYLDKPFSDTMHNPSHGGIKDVSGSDIFVKVGAPVLAAEDGKIIALGCDRRYGNTVTISHKQAQESERNIAFTTFYGHLEKTVPGLTAGSEVKAKQQIGTAGDTVGCLSGCESSNILMLSERCKDICPNKMCGKAGGTIPHLHFETDVAGVSFNPFSALNQRYLFEQSSGTGGAIG